MTDVLQWADSGWEASFTGCTEIAIMVSTGGDRADAGGRAKFYVDGRQEALLAPGQPLTRVTGLDMGLEHTLRLHKCTEPYLGNLVVSDLVLGAGGRFTAPPPAPARQIEVIGDSITSGWGNLGSGSGPPSGSVSAVSAVQDSTLAYGDLAARARGADLRQIAWAGRTLLPPAAGRDDGLSRRSLPQIWRPPGVRLSHEGSSEADKVSAGWRPNAVVVNLGTNDLTYASPHRADFIGAIEKFTRTLRQAYGPDPFILWAVGPMLSDEPSVRHSCYVQAGVDSIKRQGGQRIKCLNLSNESGFSLAGVQGHPSVADHQTMARILCRVLDLNLGWEHHPKLDLLGHAEGLTGNICLSVDHDTVFWVTANGPFRLPEGRAVGQGHQIFIEVEPHGTTCRLLGSSGVMTSCGPQPPLKLVCALCDT